MTIQEMDICLNISTEPAAGVSANTKRRSMLKSSVKKLKKVAVEKKESKKSNKLQGVPFSQTKGIKRVKQKALASIVAKKLQQNNIHNNSQNTQKLSNLRIQSKNKNNISTAVTNQLERVLSASNVQNTDTNEVVTEIDETEKNVIKEPIISFVKPSKKLLGKAIVKKRNINETGSKKSLSEIFSNQVMTKNVESTSSDVILNVKTDEKDTVQVPYEQSAIEQSSKRLVPIKRLKKLDINTDNRKKKHLKNITEHKAQKNESSDKTYKTYKKQTGKTSSLFRNNPEVPNIGQRFVKPISETVFTKTNFSDFDVHPFMVSNLEQNMNITKMTTVQQMTIPEIFSGRDVLIRSQTGSGKTLAYAIPIVECLHKIRPKLTRSSGLSALVVVPTRELAFQTYECFLKLRKPFTWIVPGYLVGGEKRKAEKARLRKGCNILVGTPGRLLDHIRHTEALKLDDVKHFVLDEADRMLDAGYEKDIAGIVDALKGIIIKSDNLGYDPMEMLKRNSRKVFTDEETTLSEENHKKERSSNDNEISNSKTDNNDINNKEDVIRQEYHSNSESDSEQNDFPIKSKKKKEKFLAKPTKKKEEDLKTSQEDLTQLPPKRQTILLSATLTQAVEKLAGLAMHNPVFVDAAKENLVTIDEDEDQINEDFVVPQSVRQYYIVTPPKLRMVTLSAYIIDRCKQSGHNKMLVFMATQDMVDYYTEILSAVLTKQRDEEDEDSDPLINVEFLKLHGNMSQKERMEVFKNFRLTNSTVLLCTDVAARGLDLPKVDCVVQYTGPLSARDYVHRIGRTARAGSSGSAVIFLTPPEVEFVRMLESKRIRINQINMETILGKLIGPLSKHYSVQEAAIALQREFEALIFEDRKLHDKACKAYVSWIRFYSTYPHKLREFFNRKELHLGHYAKSFGLSDRPQRIGGIGKKLREQENIKVKHNNRLTIDRPDRKIQEKQDGVYHKTGALKKVRMLNVSEYDSGLPALKKPKKT
ncbi:probable ATP-dependent RNA helicase DDX31 isoform X1 [Vespa crabro]|uniref:probable ATP-dependent RNA helicase DDX31 isoform X1 n=1 Tax=Vespa crabro TaxID=7445 RepID=UPI001F00A836|nr:probable ATP-dependent RNA helicase DDX31 isoform X1 [Vespa crabro]